MKRVLIAVPTYENIYPDTFKSIYDLERGEYDLDFDFVRGYDVANARNKIAKELLDRGHDYCLMIDSDTVLPKNALLNLLETEQEFDLTHSAVVGYSPARHKRAKNETGRTTAYRFSDNRDYVANDTYTTQELKNLCLSGRNRIQIRGSGLGCALIHRSVFEKIAQPFFKWVTYESGAQLSEDLFFCEKLKSANIPLFVDTRVSCGHMMRYVDF